MIYHRLHLEVVVGLYTLSKSSNRSTRNFDILVKLETVRTIPLFQAKVLYNRGNFPKYHYDLSISRICITIQNRYPHSVKSKIKKKHLNHLKEENIWKTKFSQQKPGLSNYTNYFYSKNNISSSFIKPHCHLKNYSC